MIKNKTLKLIHMRHVATCLYDKLSLILCTKIK
jgi:hypothetical protein